jgi:hypothetical protein
MPGKAGWFDLTSLGADGVAAGDGVDSDIVYGAGLTE